MPGKYLLLFTSTVHMFLGSPSCLFFAGIQAAFNALLMGVGGCVLRIKLSAETSILTSCALNTGSYYA